MKQRKALEAGLSRKSRNSDSKASQKMNDLSICHQLMMTDRQNRFYATGIEAYENEYVFHQCNNQNMIIIKNIVMADYPMIENDLVLGKIYRYYYVKNSA